MKSIFTLLLVFLHFLSFGYIVSGRISDDKGPVPFASVYLENSTYGVVSNEAGKYFLQLDPGKYTLMVENFGYETVRKEIEMTDHDLTVDFHLKAGAKELEEAVVKGKKEDPAYPIIRKAIANRKLNGRKPEELAYDLYSKLSLEVENLKLPDSLKDLNYTKTRVNFIESFSRVYFEAPDHYHEKRKAYRDLADKYSGSKVTLSFGYEYNWAKQMEVNPYLYGVKPEELVFDLYENMVDLPVLSERPYLSPIAGTALISYKYRFIETFLEDGVLVHKIQVIPRNKAGNLFNGTVYIRDDNFAFQAIDLKLNPLSLVFFDDFNVIQRYSQLNDSTRVVSRQEFFYNTSDSRHLTKIGHTLLMYSNIVEGEKYPENEFKGAEILYTDEAEEQDSVFWERLRPIKLKPIEMEYVHTQDSIRTYHLSDEYLMYQDSIVNHVGFWDITLNGIYHRNRNKKTSFSIDALLSQVRPFAVGGYRHRLGGSFSKEWTKANAIRTYQYFDYGVLNKDVRGGVDIAYTYLPKKFGAIKVGYDNGYTFVNNYESISASFSRSNYVARIDYRLGTRLEIINGLYMDVTTKLEQYKSIEGLTLSRWSGELFGGLNQPQAFTNYSDAIIDLRLRYVFGQKFVMKPYKKEIIPGEHGELNLQYKKGLPKLFNSTVNYDFIELVYKDRFKFRNFGTSAVKVHTGSFINDASVRLTNRKFFRGSDKFFFSDPLRSFQLLGPSISTTHNYFQAQYIHHFNGTLLNKVPLLKYLRIQAVGGAGVLRIREARFNHAEIYGGIERVFRIKSQLFKISTFYVVADSNHSNLAGQFKFGIQFFDPYGSGWQY